MTSGAPELVVAARCELGEGPVWDDREGALLWVDIHRGRLHRFFPETGACDHLDLGGPLGAVVPCSGGGLLLAARNGVKRLEAIETGAFGALQVDVEPQSLGNRVNDGKCDSHGRFWIGTMSESTTLGAGSLYRIDADLSVTPVVKGTTISNGLGWSPSDESMYFIDSPRQTVWAFDFDAASGTIENRRDLISIPSSAGMPDGMTVDREGGLWIALWGGAAVHRYAPSGALEAEIELPVPHVSSCAFGGSDFEDLYVTTATAGLSKRALHDHPDSGGVFRLRPGVQGFPATPFAA